MPNPNVGLHAASAATCDAGYYLENGSCTSCTSGYYCPDENTKTPCPANTTDWYAEFTAQGYDVLEVHLASRLYSWVANSGGPAYAIDHCRVIADVLTSVGDFHIEANYTISEYGNYTKLWFKANPGYYLSRYLWSNWYASTKPCTNAPAHARYTGPGTPDEPRSGGATDYNDCPWACDAGYGRVGDTCQPLCGAGVTYIHAGVAAAPLFPTPPSSPALVVRMGGGVCYGNLTAGHGAGINVTIAGTTYHVE